MRKVMAVLAAPGLIAGVHIFTASFFGLTTDKSGGEAFLPHLGIFAIGIPGRCGAMGKVVNPFRGTPRWVLRSFQLLFLPFIAVFFTFLALIS